MEALEIESQTDQTPLTSSSLCPTQGELTETEHLFDDPDDWFDSAFAFPIDRFAQCCLEFVRHFYLGACILGRRLRQWCEPLQPTGMMGITARRNVGFDPALATRSQRCRAKIPSVQRRRIG